jgi:hypothetical protein
MNTPSSTNPKVADFDILLGILSTPQSWIKKEFAKTKDGDGIGWGSSSSAVCWCLLGATEKLCIRPDAHFEQIAAEMEHREQINKLLTETIRKLFPKRVEEVHSSLVISHFNDHDETTYEDVLLVLKTAKESCEQTNASTNSPTPA